MQGLVTVFGGTGFVGAQVVRALARSGARIRVAVRNPGRGYRLRMLGDVGQIQIVQANIRNHASITRALEGAEACVNAAGISYNLARQTFVSVNIEGAEAIAAACKAKKIGRMVQISTLGADENSSSAYLRSKAQGEAAVRKLIPGAVIIRPAMAFGADDQYFNQLGALAASLPLLPLFGGGQARMQPVYIADVAAAVARAVEDPDCAGHTYELGGPGVYTVREAYEMVCAVTYRRRPLIVLPWPAASMIGFAGDVLASLKGVVGLLPAPLLTRDQVEMLKSDNLVAEGAEGLAALGVRPTPIEPILPTYMYRYRKGGQFAVEPAKV